MKNEEKNTLILKWLNDELTPDELKSLEALEDYPLLSKIADYSQDLEIPEIDSEGVKTNLNQYINEQTNDSTNRFNLFKLAAVFLVLISSLFLIKYFSTPSMVTFTNVKAEQTVYTLPDESKVTLFGVSSIDFNRNEWEDGKRNLVLNGEGYFEVQKGSKFTVETNQGKVTVLGTKFNVKTLDNFFAVECFEGKVQVERDAQKTILTKGKGVIFNKTNVSEIDIVRNQPQWILGEYRYNKMPLNIVFNDLENLYNVTLETSEVSINDKIFSGSIIKDNLDNALKAICLPMRLTFDITDHKIVIHSK